MKLPKRYGPDDYSEYGAVYYTGPIVYQGNTAYQPSEQDEVIRIFSELLRLPTKDGGRKRAAGEKPNWKVDGSHRDAMYRHLHRWEAGELADRDSGANPLVHVAWRALALAYQEAHPVETHDRGLD